MSKSKATIAKPFEFLSLGVLAYIGGNKALAQVRPPLQKEQCFQYSTKKAVSAVFPRYNSSSNNFPNFPSAQEKLPPSAHSDQSPNGREGPRFGNRLHPSPFLTAATSSTPRSNPTTLISEASARPSPLLRCEIQQQLAFSRRPRPQASSRLITSTSQVDVYSSSTTDGTQMISFRKGGWAGWILWRSVYLTKQVAFRNRVLVLFDWMKSRVFGRDIACL